MITAQISRVLAFAVLFAIGPGVTAARATDGTWTDATSNNEWTTGTNWNSTPPATVPDNTAIFTTIAPAKRSVTISTDASINTIRFNAAAPAYVFTNAAAFTITGNGIVNNSTTTFPSFINNGFLNFSNSSRAGNAIITNNSSLQFVDASTAGTATITNNGFLGFLNTSTGGNATISNSALGTLTFSDNVQNLSHFQD